MAKRSKGETQLEAGRLRSQRLCALKDSLDTRIRYALYDDALRLRLRFAMQTNAEFLMRRDGGVRGAKERCVARVLSSKQRDTADRPSYRAKGAHTSCSLGHVDRQQ